MTSYFAYLEFNMDIMGHTVLLTNQVSEGQDLGR